MERERVHSLAETVTGILGDTVARVKDTVSRNLPELTADLVMDMLATSLIGMGTAMFYERGTSLEEIHKLVTDAYTNGPDAVRERH